MTLCFFWHDRFRSEVHHSSVKLSNTNRSSRYSTSYHRCSMFFQQKCWWKSSYGTLPHPERPCPLETKMRKMILATTQTQSYQAMPCFRVVTSTSFTCCCGFGGNNKSETNAKQKWVMLSGKSDTICDFWILI